MQDDNTRPPRREFIGQLGMMAFAASIPRNVEARSTSGDSFSHLPRPASRAPLWDMSWVERISPAPYKVVIDSTKVEGDSLFTAGDILDTFHDVYNTPDDQTRVVVVMRHFGAAMGLTDALWDKYAIGEERTVTDPATKAPAKRNIFLRAGPNDKEKWELNSKIEPLVARGVTFLVCSRAAMSLASSLAKKVNKPVEEVQADVKAGLVPGAFLMPNGVFAVIRAQNAGCAFFKNS